MAIYKKIINFRIPSANNISPILSRNGIWNYQMCATYKHKTLERKLDLPPRPKRPLTPFFQYTQSQRSILSANNPSVSAPNLIKMMAENWRTVDTTEKEKLRENFKVEMEEYTKKMMLYEKSLSDDQKEQMKFERLKGIEAQERNKMKSRLKELGRPKKPATTFVLYMMSMLNTRSKNTKFSEWLITIARKYAELSEDEKMKWIDESKKLMEQYKNDMLTWENKMIKMGHIDVIRKQVLLELKGKDCIPAFRSRSQ